MPARRPSDARPRVFINCPFDDDYGELLRALAFAVAVCGYSIETPRLLLGSTSRRFPSGIGNGQDQVGRYLMVQGATQVAGRFPYELRMYKAPPPEISSEQFYETDESRGFARGFSLQTISPLPIGWAEHVLACDRWDRPEHNLRAIAKHVEAIRGQERWGVGSVAQAFRGYQALPSRATGKPWWEWDRELVTRDANALARVREELADDVRFWQYVQFLFFRQWAVVREAAHARGIRIMGDVPIYVASDSADVWGNPELFQLDDDGCPTVVAGVPPGLCDHVPSRSRRYQWKSKPGAMTSATR